MTRRRAGAALFVLGVVTLLLTAEVPTPERAAILNPLTGQPTSDTPLQRSLWLALGAALVALLLGLPYALAVERWRVAGRRLLLVAGVTPLIVPPYLATIAWRGVFGPGGRVPLLLGWRPPPGPSVTVPSLVYTVPTGALLLGACLFPLVLFPAWAALRRLPASQLEAARLARGLRGERALLARALLPAACAGALAVAALALVEFALPQLLRIKVQSEQVYFAFQKEHDTARALLLALRASAPLLGAAAACAGGILLLPWGRRALGGSAPATRPLSRPAQVAAWLGCLLALAPGAWLPLLDVALRLIHRPAPPGARVPQGLARLRGVLEQAWTIGAPDAERSVWVGVLTATLGVALALGLAWWARRAGALTLAAGAALAALAVATPAPLVGMLVLVGLTQLKAYALLDGLGCLVLAHLLRFAPLALVLIAVAARGLREERLEAARLAGRSPLLGVGLPQLAPTLLAAWALLYVLAVTEYSATAVVEPPGQQVLALFVVNQAHYGEVSELAGLCTLLLGVVLWPLPPLAGLALWARRRA